MSKSATLHIRIEPETKVNVEKVLNDLGMTTAEAINIYFNQIIINNGIPFEINKKSKNNFINKRKSLRGYLSKYANASLIEKEKNIWYEEAHE